MVFGNKSLYKWSRSHMTNVATMPIYGKNLKKIFYWTKRLMTLKVGMQHCVLKYYQICSNDDPGLTLTFLRPGQIWSPMLLYGEKSKTMDFSEAIVFHDVKVGKSVHEPLWMSKVTVIYWLWFKSLRFNILNFFSSITSDFNISSAHRWVIQDQWASGF